MAFGEEIELHRVRTELSEVAMLLDAAEEIANALVDILTHVYDHDHRTSEALAAANRFAASLNDVRLAAQRRTS